MRPSVDIEEVFARIEAENPGVLEIAHEVDPPYWLAWNVYKHRNARGMTQAELAEAIGVSQPRIAKIERGDANPRLITLSKLAHALGVTIPELLVDFGRNKRSGSAAASPEVELAKPQHKRRVG